MAKPADQVRADLSLFFRFATEKVATPADQLVAATSRLVTRCPAAGPAVLSLYGSIFEEYCLHFVQTSAGSTSRPGVYLSLVTSSSATPAKFESAEVRRSLSERRPSDPSKVQADETPASPPPVSSDSALDSDQDDQFQAVKLFIDSLSQSLVALINNDDGRVSKSIADWALVRLCDMGSQFESLRERMAARCGQEASSTNQAVTDSIKEKIDYWRSCPVIDTLIRLVLRSMEKDMFDLKDVLIKLMNFRPESGSPPQTEWICCAVITSAQGMTEISSCIKFLLNSQVSESVKEAIFSFLSSQNPESVITCSKANIPFLLRLCSKSKALLHVMSERIIRSHVDIKHLNQMTNLKITENNVMRQDLIVCLLSSEHSFDLLIILCQISVHEDANQSLRSEALCLLDAVVDEVQTCVYSGNGSKIVDFLDQVKQNYEQVVSSLRSAVNHRLRKVLSDLIKLLTIHYGVDLAVILLHDMFDKLSPVKPFDVYNMSSYRPHSALTSLLDCLKLSLGRQMKDVCNKLLAVDKWKSDTFWVNFLSLVRTNAHVFDVETEVVAEHLTDLLQMDLYDLYVDGDDRINTLIIVLEIICLSVEHNVCPVEKFSHSLCLSLVICYVNVVERVERISEVSSGPDQEMEKLLVALFTAQRIMKNLCKAGNESASQQMLTRTFLDCILCWDQDVGQQQGTRDRSVVDVCLKKENMTYGGSAFKFRKIPLNPGKDLVDWKNQQTQQPLLSRPFARQLLLQGLKSSIKNMDLFSHLLVESITPDVLFNDMTWPDEDFLKVTIERDLLIFKKYDKHCILWDLTELVAEHGLLRNCSVLIRALFAVQLTYWASGTSSDEPEPQSLQATQRLIRLLAQSDLIPEQPFRFVPDVLPHLNSWEIFCVCNDLWKLIRDTSMNQTPVPTLKPYLERLRVIMGHKCPGQTFVKIFRNVSGTNP